MPRKLLAPVLALLMMLALSLAGTGLVGAAPGPAGAAARQAPTFASICATCVTFDPVETRFDAATATLTAVVEVDVPGDWVFVSGVLNVFDPKNVNHSDWLKLDSQSRIGQRHLLTFKGQVPNQLVGGVLNRGYFRTDPIIFYRFNNVLRLASKPTINTYYYHLASGETRGTLTAPASITTGTALALSGNVSCFRAAGFQTIEEGAYIGVQYSPTGANTWTTIGSTQASKVDGSWSFTVPSVGATLDWRAQLSPNTSLANACTQGRVSPTANVVAGTLPPPPPPPTLPGAPGLVVGAVTQSSIAVNWSAPTEVPGGAPITGYRFGYDSANGQPQPTFSVVVPSPAANPYVFTGLCAGCSYSVWAEAVTAAGNGARTTLSAATAAVPPPPPAPKAPGAPRNVQGAAKSHKAVITWDAAADVPGSGAITGYCVHQFNSSPDKCVSASRFKVKFKHLKNGATYSFTVQAFAGDVPGPLSAVVKVRPHR